MWAAKKAWIAQAHKDRADIQTKVADLQAQIADLKARVDFWAAVDNEFELLLDGCASDLLEFQLQHGIGDRIWADVADRSPSASHTLPTAVEQEEAHT